MRLELTPKREINLWRFLPVVALLSAGLYLITCQWPYLFSVVLMLVVVTFVGIQIRVGNLPWFETKEGQKQRLVVWLESKIPFLRSDFWRK